MKRKIEKNMWCDSMCCEKNIAWMVGSEINALFQLDFNTKSYHFITDFPNASINNIRQNQLCLKICNDIYFFPDRGKSVWIYNLLNRNFKEILINNPDNVRITINMVFYW